MNWRLNQSLRAKVLRLTSASVLLAMLATVAAVVLFEITTFRPRALENAQTQADLIAEIIVPALEFDDQATAEKMLTILRHETAVVSSAVYRVDGSRLAQYHRGADPAETPAVAPAAINRIEGREIIISLKVAANGTEIGRVWLKAVLPGWRDRITQYSPILLLIALAVVVLSLFISFATRRQITDPLQTLAETVQQVGQNRDLQLRVPEAGRDEIGDLARSFNTMLETLAERDRDQRVRESRLARQNQGLVDMARAQKEAPEDPAAQTRRLTEILAEVIEVERAGIWLFTPDQADLKCLDLYERGPARHHSGLSLPVRNYPDFFAALEKERVIEAGAALTDPRTREFNEGYAIPLGIGAMLDIPVRWRGRIAGVLCLEHIGGTRAWQLDETGFAISAADRVALFLEAEESSLAAAGLRESEERNRSLIEQARDAIFTLSLDGEILGLNQAVETITGWKPELWIGRNFTDPLLPQDREKARALFAAVARGEHPPSFELQIRTRKGSMVTLEFALSPQHKHDRVVGLLGIGRDVTERKQASEAQAGLEAQLRQSQKMEAVGNLAGGIAHDFNNILTAIICNAQLAEMEFPEQHPARPYLLQTLLASHRAKELVQQILAFSRRQEQKRVPTDLPAVVRETLKLLRSVLPATVEISTRLPDGLPQILADSTQINQVIVNLATNAAHAMEEQGGRLEVKVEGVTVDQEMVNQKPQLRTGRFVRLWISDTGTGMTKEVQQRIFEPFFTTKEIGKGTGLGLAVVHGIVQQHDGAIVVYSAPGKGTAFQIFFPVIATAGEATAPAAPTGRSHSPVKPSGDGQCIMLVDDEDLVLSVAETVLRRAGYRVVPFNEPLLALKAFRETPGDFHLIITDLTMPKIKGTKLAAEMRTLRPGLPIILATGFGGGLDTSAMQSAGLFGPLQKPFTSDELIGAVERALKASGRR